jgi:PAS domain S-box-containing protein
MADIVLLFDSNGRCFNSVPANPSLLDHPATEFIGKNVHDIFRAHQADRLLQLIRQALEQRKSLSCLFGMRINGADAYFAASIVPLTATSVIFIAHDITEQKRTEAALRQLVAIVESSGDAIIGKDLNGTILSWNAGAERLSGYSADEMLGRPVTLLIPPDRPNEVAHIREKLKRGEQVEHFETVRLRKDGTRVDVSLTILPIRDESGTPIGTSVLAHDISARKHLEAQYLHIQKLDSLGRFASAIAHDFNNLLAAIVGNAELGIEAIRSGHTARNELEEIRKIARRAANLTRQLLAFARQQALDLQEVNINDLIRDMECMLRQLIGPQIDLSMSLAAERGWIKAYLGHIEQLLVNLVVNARDALPDGGTLTIATATAPYAQVMGGRGTDMQPGQFVGIIVADTGSGMSEEVKRHLFEPFFTTKAPGKGVGLGLATCFGIVKQYGGSIWIDSAPGQGTTVNIYFPCIE